MENRDTIENWVVDGIKTYYQYISRQEKIYFQKYGGDNWISKFHSCRNYRIMNDKINCILQYKDNILNRVISEINARINELDDLTENDKVDKYIVYEIVENILKHHFEC